MKILPAALALVFASTACVNAWALPVGAQVVSGAASLNQAGNALTITNSANAILNWQKFSISANELVRFQQPSASSNVLNRVVTQNPSAIFGQLLSNGHVWLVNPAGILVGAGATIDTAGFVASTLNISNADFLAGRLLFNKDVAAPGSLVNQGIITTSSGGSVYLIGTHVTNQGIITTPQGESILAAGQTVSLVDTAIPGVKVDITGDGTTTNLGSILAEAGRIGIAGGLVRNQGLISAGSAVSQGGRVFIKAGLRAEIGGTVSAQGVGGGTIAVLADMQNGTVNINAVLEANAPSAGNGGFIETSAAHVQVADGARITTAAPNGKTGTWLIDPNDYTIAASGGDITGTQLSTNLGSNNVTIVSSSGATAGSGDINVNDAVSWSANTLTLTAARDININAVMTASGTSALALNPATANGADAAVAGGTVKTGFNTDGTFRGRVDFGARSGTGFLTINGNGYTVINSLGAEGSITGTDLQGMNGNLAGLYALGSNIDATATSGWNWNGSIFQGFLPVGDGNAIVFTGAFDGLGHTITGLTINRLSSTSEAGLFGSVGFPSGAAIRNVGLVGGSVTGISYVGALVGWNYLGTITNSYNTGSVRGTNQVGGLVGGNFGGGTISNSYSTGTVTCSASSGRSWSAGGLVGYNYSTIDNSYSTGTVNGTDRVGGLVGFNQLGTISNSYSTGAVTGNDRVGGLVGYNYWDGISNSYSTGAVTGITNVGGLSGLNIGTITNSYWDTQTSLQPTSAGGAGKTTAEMKQLATFIGWDFANTWRIDEGVSYPTLRAFWVPPPPSNTWLGLLDNYWTTVGNWSFGHVPTATETVNIPYVAGTAFVQMAGGTYTVKSITSAELFNITGTGTSFMLTQGGSFNAGLNLGAGTSLTSQGTLSLSSYTLGSGAKINLTQAGAGLLTIGGLPYTVINSLGAAGSATATDLQGMGGTLAALAGRYALGSNIDASATSAWNVGAGFEPVGNVNARFTGTFDGLGHTVTGLTINRPSTDYVGLFGITEFTCCGGGGVRNVGLIGGYVYGRENVGGLAGYSFGTITNSYSTGGNVVGTSYVGGLVGWSGSSAIITNSYNTNVVGGTSIMSIGNVGGLVGRNDGIISNSYNTGSVNGTVTSNYVGGLVGKNQGIISNAYNIGSVTSTGNYTGGLVGSNESGGTISNSYSTGNANGPDFVGGLVGTNLGIISNSYSAGNVSSTGSYVGGLAGHNPPGWGTISNSYWDIATSGRATSAGGTGLTTTQMTQQASFTGWDFSAVWNIDQGASYPYLRANEQNPHPVPLFLSNTWLGLLDSYWTTVGNWSLGHVPTSTEQVNIPDVTGTAFVQMAGGTYTVKSITSAEVFNITGTGTSFMLTQGGSFNAGLNLGAGTSLTSQATLSLSSYTLGSGAKINLTQSGASILTIGGLPYTVINSLGAAGSTTGIDLQGMSGNLAGRYAMGSDIDASATSSWNSGAGFAPVGYVTTKFTGTLDGLGHTITGLTVNRPANYEGVGLFGITNGSIISNVGLVGGSVTGSSYVGGLAGRNVGSISNSYNTGSVSGNTGNIVGGLVGANDGTISDSYSTGAATLTCTILNGLGQYTGGLVGWNYAGTITNSYSTGAVTGIRSTGGLVGFNDTGTITNSYSASSVSGSYGTGGLVGGNSGIVTNSYSSGSVSGSYSTGGLAGSNLPGSGTITNSYSTGSVSGGSWVGGLVGSNMKTITGSYSTGSVTGYYNVGGLVGDNYGLDAHINNSYWNTETSGKANCVGSGSGINCTGMTTAQMKQQASFSGWDFTTVWNIDQDASFPYLRANEQKPHPTALTFTSMGLVGAAGSVVNNQIVASLSTTQSVAAVASSAGMSSVSQADLMISSINALNPLAAGGATTGSGTAAGTTGTATGTAPTGTAIDTGATCLKDKKAVPC